ncbi:MAG: hypothetical protein ACRC8S_20545 [Fimbriiglobus sp.]
MKKVKDLEHEKFNSLIGENKTHEQAKKIIEEAGDGFFDGWVEEHWLRYQLEQFKEKIDKVKNKPNVPPLK